MSGEQLTPPPAWERLAAVLGEPRVSAALSLAALGTLFAAPTVRALMGWGGLIGALTTLGTLSALSLWGQRRMLEWTGLLPVSILLFVGWSAISLVWSAYPGATVEASLYQLGVAFLGVYLALVRDTIQVVRTVGDVLRFLLVVSLAVEVLSGLLIDTPLPFLGVTGSIASGGPIEGLFGTRNELGLVSLVALVTFLVELRTRSVPRWRSAWSLPLALVCVALSRSPVIAVALVVVGVATGALYLLRRMPASSRWWGQVVLAVVLLVAGVVALVLRHGVVALLSAGSALDLRLELWSRMVDVIRFFYPLHGWGWMGYWRTQYPPYSLLDAETPSHHGSGLNAFLDVTVQLGVVGLLLFVVLVVLAFGRSWLLASTKRSTIHVWAPLVITALATVSFAESSILVGADWFLFVVCAVKAAQGLSWRSALARPS